MGALAQYNNNYNYHDFEGNERVHGTPWSDESGANWARLGKL